MPKPPLPADRVAPVAGKALIRGGLIWDGSDDSSFHPLDIIVGDGLIQTVGPRGSIAAGPETDVLDVSGKYVIPGLVDMHIHLAPGNVTELCVAAGVTTVRDVGNYSEWVFGLRAATENGSLAGPRIFAVGEIIEGPIPCRRGFARVSSPDEARVAVRAILDRGADGIKLYQSLQPSIVTAAIDEAHRRGAWVAGHLCCMNFVNAHYASEGVSARYEGHEDCEGALEAGVDAGIDTLEHAFATSTRVLDKMAKNRVVLCPTLGCGGGQGGFRDPTLLPDLDLLFEEPNEVFGRKPVPDRNSVRAELWFEAQKALVSEFHEAGGRVLTGTDSPFGVAPGFGLHREFEILRDCGLSNHEILVGATRAAAETLRAADRQGTIATGKAADLVILAADPFDDISNTRSITTVVQSGRIYDQERLAALRNSKQHYLPNPLPVSRSETPIAYEARGHGPAIVVLADGPGASAIAMGRREGAADWYSLSELSLANRVLFIDPLGTGKSPPPPGDNPLTPDSMAGDIERVREAEGQESLSLVAHGAGAITALAYARKFGERLRRLVLVCPVVDAGALEAELQRLLETADDDVRNGLLAAAHDGAYGGDSGGYREAYWQAARQIMGTSHQPYTLMLGFRYDSLPTSFQWPSYRKLWKPNGEFEVTGEWSDHDALAMEFPVEFPLLLILGAFDEPAKGQVDLIRARFPRAQAVTMWESGHFPFVEEADRFMRTVRAFLSDRPNVTEVRLVACAGSGELPQVVDALLATDLGISEGLTIAGTDAAREARFTVRPEIVSHPAGDRLLRVAATDSGATPSETTIEEQFEDRAGLEAAVRRAGGRVRAWAGDPYATVVSSVGD